MLKRLFVKNFTVFAEADFEFGPGLNVVVGTNGTGKSHVLKLGYAVLNCQERRLKALSPQKSYEEGQSTANSPKPRPLDFADLDEKLVKILRPAPSHASEFIRRGAMPQEAIVEYEVSDTEYTRMPPGRLAISPNSSRETPLQQSPTVMNKLAASLAAPVFIPAKEILTLGWMRPASGQLKLPLDDSYLDLLNQLSGLPLQQPEPAAAAALEQLTSILGGEVEEDNGRFYLVFPKEQRLDMNMVAEGLRKFGTLQKLLANGSLTPKSTLFWDEPEANLNPALLKKLAAVLAELARQGFQIVLATHSLFLLKELHVLAQQPDMPIRYFGLYKGPDGATDVERTNDLEELTHVTALDEELEQTARFQRVLDNEDTHAKHS
ncbi:AAA family ATPase [Hymenobacter mucosus]|uniref:ATPase/GTPase, AAA15 family n=1 Tax=Hymenobacter mucosus TaxID=1411120 RepID=A0A239AWX0_9BACT|nr:AAA family ATPase [Hymenobacter mucosus]SNR99463.1 ATPase/GTPase, AAA15 family [Hymenobacter mucosus]